MDFYASILSMGAELPEDIEALKALLIAARADVDTVTAERDAAVVGRNAAVAERDAVAAERDVAAADAAAARAEVSDIQAMIAYLKLEIAKLKRQHLGQTSERSSRLIDQMELQLEELEATASEDDLLAEMAVAKTTNVTAFTRKKPSRKPFPEHLPRERIVHASPTSCSCCGGIRLSKLGEDVTETLEVIPRSWKVIQHVREKFSCRDCETISQAPAPFHVVPRGWAGPSLLAMILFEKYGQHQPLNRQATRYALEGVDLSLSTLADQVGHCAVALAPLVQRLKAHVMGASRLHGDDTHVPVLAKGKADVGRSWTYVRDDRPFGGAAAPAALFYYSRNRGGVHIREHLDGWTGILQADAFGGYSKLYAADRQPAPILEAACWAHSRRKFFELADIEASARRKAEGDKPSPISPMALEAVRRIDALFEIERAINGKSAEERLAARQEHSAPLVADLEAWMRSHRAKLSRGGHVAKAMDYMLTRWSAFARFLEDGRICLTNNAAERALRGIALGRKSWLFAGSDRGGQRAAVMYSLIVTAKMNDVDPQAWLADVLGRIADHPASKLDELLPWNWKRLWKAVTIAA